MKKTALFESHKLAGARFIPFAGYHMPFSYTNPRQEHERTRKTGSLFDVSHMGQIRIKGKKASSFLQHLLPTDTKSLKEGKAAYSALLNEEGGMLDDIIVYCKSQEDYLLCVNAGTKDKDLEWIMSFKKELVEILDESEFYSLIAVQGPRSHSLLEKVFPDTNFSKIPRFSFQEKEDFLFSNTGYTGEKGFEIYLPTSKAKDCWEKLKIEGEKLDIREAGLGSRDTLRLEMGYLLSGVDFDETKSLPQAGISWIIKNKEEFIGKKRQEEDKKNPELLRLKGFIMEEEGGIPRKSHKIHSPTGEEVGVITSGAKSPSLGKILCLGYVRGNEKTVFIDIRGDKKRAFLSPLPFLKKAL